MDEGRARLQDFLLTCFKEPLFKVDNIEKPALEFFGVECADRLKIRADLDKNGVLINLKYSGSGCVIFLSSFEALARLVFGKSVDESIAIVNDFKGLIGGCKSVSTRLGALSLLANSPVLKHRLACLKLALEGIIGVLKFEDMI